MLFFAEELSNQNACDRAAGFLCYDGTCISKSLQNDGYVDCKGNSHDDEQRSTLHLKTCGDIWRLGFESGVYPITLTSGTLCSDLNLVFTP